ncbi:MAG: hypothetical protein U0234_29055 [Sandaracinus sp.]
MSNRSRLPLLALLVLSICAPTSRALAWPTVDAESGHRVTMLGGRWSLALPDDTSLSPTTGGPSGFHAPQTIDGIATVSAPEGHFAIRATLLETTRPADLEAAVRATPPPCASPTYGTLGDRTDLVVIRCTEPSPDGALRPLVGFAVHTDGWVDRIETQIEVSTGASEEAHASAVAYAEAVLGSLRAETAEPDVERGAVALAEVCNDAPDTLALALPEDWIATRQTVGGTTLIRATQLTPMGAPRAMIAIELSPAGTEPPRVPEGAGVLRDGSLLGGAVRWLVVESPSDPAGLRQLASEITVDCGASGTWARALRISIGGPREQLAEAQTITETIALGSEHGRHATLAAVSSEAPVEPPLPLEGDAEGDEAVRVGHLWSYAIAGVSIAMLIAALVLRGRNTRPK